MASVLVPGKRNMDLSGEAMTVEETERLLGDILQYVRASAVGSVRPVARSTIDSERKAKVYALMTGDKSQPDIASVTAVAQQTVSRFQRDFLASGLAAPPDKSHRYPRALFTLEELGLSELVQGVKVPEGKDETALASEERK